MGMVASGEVVGCLFGDSLGSTGWGIEDWGLGWDTGAFFSRGGGELGAWSFAVLKEGERIAGGEVNYRQSRQRLD